MKYGVVFPQTEIGNRPDAVCAFALAAEEIGFDHLIAYDHILGVDPATRPNWKGFYSHKDLFHEVFVLFGYLAGVTKSLGLASGVLVLPQRQTALVAKQAAAIDILSGGRLRLGVGLGWNHVEYEALGEDFSNRGLRSEEQIDVLKKLWANDLVTYKGRWHKITDAGINPLPKRRAIPIWLGGGAEQVLKRIAKMGEGWFIPGYGELPNEEWYRKYELLQQFSNREGRDFATIGIEKIVNTSDSRDELLEKAGRWEEAGATHFSVNTMGAGLKTPTDHIAAIRFFKESVTE